MAVINVNLSCDLQQPVKVQYLNGVLFSQDNQANKINVTVLDGGEAASISGSVTANIIRSDGGTVAATGGTISGNVASIVLPSAAYSVPGVVSIVVKLTTSGVITTLAAVVANMYESSTATAVDPGTIIPSVTTLISQIETAVASIPADYSSLWTSLAPAFSSSATYAPGQYVTYNGALYVCTYAHTGSWNAKHFVATNLEAGLSAIERAAIYSYPITGNISTDGNLYPLATQYMSTDFIPIDSQTSILLRDIYTGGSTLAYAFYNSEKTFISGQNNLTTSQYVVTSIPSNAKYVRFSSRVTDGGSVTWNPSAYVYNFKKIEAETSQNTESIASITGRVGELETLFPVRPKDTTFFDIYDFIDSAFIDFWGALVGNDEKIWANASATSIKLRVEPNTTYVLEIPNADRNTGTSNTDGVFETGVVYTTLSCTRSGDLITFTTGANIHYAVIYFYNGVYDTSHGTQGIHLYKNSKKTDITPTVKLANLPVSQLEAPYLLDILVFGDSITDTANITIDSQTDRTTAYSIKNPNNSYVKDGVTIQFAMWPTLIQRVLNVRELRNYALAGAHFYTTSTPPSNPRSKLLYQVQLALNDLSNPNHVFPNDDFSPDIVIVACGINDGNISAGSYETAMSKTIMNQAGTGVDVEATMNNLTQTDPMQAMRYVCMLLKQTFPEALFLYVNPLQQTYSTNEARLIAREELRKMAEQYDFINLDGFGQFGIVRDFETQEQIGLLTKDGLHPNEKGQNLYARNMVQAIKRYYFPLNNFNT